MEAYSTARRLIRDQGILCGPSSGAVVAAAIRCANQQSPSTHESRAVVILNDSATHYTSTLLNDDWIFANDLADELMVKDLEYLSYDRYRAVIDIYTCMCGIAKELTCRCSIGKRRRSSVTCGCDHYTHYNGRTSLGSDAGT